MDRMVLKIEKLMKPDLYCDDLDQLDLEKLFHAGYRLLLIDVDNTLADHGSFEADDYAQRTIQRARDIGFECRIISNAGRKRIRVFANSLAMPYTAMANKPSVRAIHNACCVTKIKPEQTVMVGDQILTDVVSAHRAGALAVLVCPRSKQEAANVRLKRLVEKWLFRHFHLDSKNGTRQTSESDE